MSRYTLFILFLCLAACNAVTNSSEEKIKAILLANVSDGLDKNAFQKVDSISIIRIDSLTQKSRLFLMLEVAKARKITDSAMCETDTFLFRDAKQRIAADPNNSRYQADLKLLTENHSDNKVNVIKSKATFDSLSTAYSKADGTMFTGFCVTYNVYYVNKQKSGVVQYTTYLDEAYNVEDKVNPLLVTLYLENE